MNERLKSLVLWSIIGLILISVFSNFSQHAMGNREPLTYSQFISALKSGQVSEVIISDKRIIGKRQSGANFSTYLPMQDEYLLGELIEQGVNVIGKPPEQQSLLLHIFINWFPMLLLIGIWLFFMRQMQGGGGRGGPLSFGRSRARLLGGDHVKTTFGDIAGIPEAKEEVQELVEFLRDPDKFQRLGGKIPCGVLLVGPPGTGKTLLAKAVAGEAKVPFFTISGSDFVEMFVGVGASRVRDMFEEAKKKAPCIIFIDELDAVGRHRGAGTGGGNDEREQTLNQLLVEMDGFEGKEGVIVIAATNRPDVLDPALLRPGRFDRQIVIPNPDIMGREQILKVHMRKVPIASDVNARVIARGTPGFSGADLANLVNEAALFAARANQKEVKMVQFEKAKDKILMGAERRSMIMSDKEKKLTAYHEAGHAIIGLLLQEKGHDPVYKVSIIPRGRALGVTMFLPEEDRYSQTLEALMSQIKSLLGGRLAEEIIFGKTSVTTGASNDIERLTQIARNVVTRWGLSRLGPITYGSTEEEVFLGRVVSRASDVSDATAESVDKEVKTIINQCYTEAKKMLEDNIEKLHLMANALIKYETIGKAQIDDVMQGKPAREPEDWVSDDAATTKVATDADDAATSEAKASKSNKPAAKPRKRRIIRKKVDDE